MHKLAKAFPKGFGKSGLTEGNFSRFFVSSYLSKGGLVARDEYQLKSLKKISFQIYFQFHQVLINRLMNTVRRFCVVFSASSGAANK